MPKPIVFWQQPLAVITVVKFLKDRFDQQLTRIEIQTDGHEHGCIAIRGDKYIFVIDISACENH